MDWKKIAVVLGIGFLLTRGSRKKEGMVSKNFSWREVTRSGTCERAGIDNIPGPMEKAALQATIINVMQPLRNAMGRPIRVTSGYRSLACNTKIGGATNSQHMRGQAIDFQDPAGNLAQMFYYIKDNLPFDQLIWEKGDTNQPLWIHVSYKSDGSNRGKVLKYQVPPGSGYTYF
jgi:hypothetical protein